mgnify:CR=1 FL=1
MAENPVNKRRDFLQLSTLSIGAVGTAAFIWPFLKSMSPAEDTLALGTTEVDETAGSFPARLCCSTVLLVSKPLRSENRQAFS